MAKRVYVGVSSKHEEVEYIQSSGTQYIDTGFKPNQNTRVVMDAQFVNATSVSKLICPFGARGGGYFYELYKASTGNWNLTFLWGTTYSQYFTLDYAVRHTFEINKNVAKVDSTSKSNTNATFQMAHPLYLCATNNTGTVESPTPMRIYACQIYDNGTLVRDYVPCVNSSGAGGLYDKVSGEFFANAGTGSFTVGAKTGVSYTTKGVARKTKKMYLGIRNVAHKVKKGYIGIGGVARPFFTGGELAYYGTITPLSQSRYSIAGASVGNYAIFGGGTNVSVTGSAPMYTTTTKEVATVDAYNKKLTRSTPTALSYVAGGISAVNVDNYAVFAGGLVSTLNSFQNVTTANAYSTSLTRTIPTALSRARHTCNTARAGSYGLFAGGRYYNNGSYPAQNVDAYNSSATRITATAISTNDQAQCSPGTSVGGYALFCAYTGQTPMVAYDSSLTKQDLGYVSSNLNYPAPTAAATTGTHALITGFSSTGVMYDTVYAYDKSLTKTQLGGLSAARAVMTSASLGENAMFAGGRTSQSGMDYVMTVDFYDASLTRKTMSPLTGAASNHGVANVGDYVLFAGGKPQNSSLGTDIVEAYVLG